MASISVPSMLSFDWLRSFVTLEGTLPVVGEYALWYTPIWRVQVLLVSPPGGGCPQLACWVVALFLELVISI